MRPWNLAASMFVLFGAVALIVASIGLYAVVSFSVAQRTTEIAVRLALGAQTRHIGATVGIESLYAVTGGLAVGVFIAILVRGSIGKLLFQTSPNDPYIIVGVAALLFGVAVVAMIVPLVRALRVNPGEVMRQA
jgi:putative ABC transport system permease protein